MLVATGIEYSGTGILAEILRTSGEEVTHWAMPHVYKTGSEFWWMPSEFPDDTRFVLIKRSENYRAAAAKSHGWTERHLDWRWDHAQFYLKRLPQNRTFIFSYEMLVNSPAPTVRILSEWLGLPLTVDETKIFDGNAKYRRQDG